MASVSVKLLFSNVTETKPFSSKLTTSIPHVPLTIDDQLSSSMPVTLS